MVMYMYNFCKTWGANHPPPCSDAFNCAYCTYDMTFHAPPNPCANVQCTILSSELGAC